MPRRWNKCFPDITSLALVATALVCALVILLLCPVYRKAKKLVWEMDRLRYENGAMRAIFRNVVEAGEKYADGMNLTIWVARREERRKMEEEALIEEALIESKLNTTDVDISTITEAIHELAGPDEQGPIVPTDTEN